MKNYYEILQVNQNASLEIIEKAYKVLAKKYHPDIQTDVKKKAFAEAKLKEINEAYDVLSDEFLREQYDLEIEKQTKRDWEQTYSDQTYSVDRNSYARNHSYSAKQSTTQNTEEETNTVSQQNKGKEKKQKSTMGTFEGLVELVKQLYHDRPKREEFKEMTKKDIFAIVLTIIIVILLGFALWFIPFTNGWMRELLFENPLFNWIGALFS